MNSEAVSIKKFYKTASFDAGDNGCVITLDGRQAKTQTKKLLAAPSEALAKAIADEWNAQDEFIDRNAMPLTGMLSAAIDGGAEGAKVWREEVLNYLGSDLLCYRAESPAGLIAKQAEIWDPYLVWLRETFGAPLVTTAGIVAVGQPDAAIAAVRSALAEKTPETLFPLRLATAISGSAVLALALWRQAFDPGAIFEASRVDERYQEEKWGVDSEAREREDRLRGEFLSIGRFLALL